MFVTELENIFINIKYLKKKINIKNLRIIYFAFELFIVLYGLCNWGSAHKSHFISLNITINSLLMITLGESRHYWIRLLYSDFAVDNSNYTIIVNNYYMII